MPHVTRGISNKALKGTKYPNRKQVFINFGFLHIYGAILVLGYFFVGIEVGVDYSLTNNYLQKREVLDMTTSNTRTPGRSNRARPGPMGRIYRGSFDKMLLKSHWVLAPRYRPDAIQQRLRTYLLIQVFMVLPTAWCGMKQYKLIHTILYKLQSARTMPLYTGWQLALKK